MTTPSSHTLPALFEVWQQTLSWQPDATQQTTFQRLFEQVLAGNRQLNLTRITEPSEFWEKHLWDSLRGVLGAEFDRQTSESNVQTVIDIGTGAGFPGIPVAIAQPTWQVTLLDSTRKKVQFLETLLDTLQITNAQTLTERVEILGQQSTHRASYNLALVRAVAAAPICAEYALPLLQVGGVAVLYRGRWSAAEAEALNIAVADLGGIVAAAETFKTPLTESDRALIYLRKVMPTPKEFPRPVGIPTQKPLGS